MPQFHQVVKKQTDTLMQNIENTLEFIPVELFNKEVNGYPIWKQIYHMLNSLDRIFIDPTNYKYPEFHTPKLNSLDYKSEDILDRNTLNNYFGSIRERIKAYMDNTDDDKLLEEIIYQGMKLTKLDLILAQFRHVTWHLGYLHSCMKVETGDLPDHISVRKEDYPVG